MSKNMCLKVSAHIAAKKLIKNYLNPWAKNMTTTKMECVNHVWS
jgi:hypothetical protein